MDRYLTFIYQAKPNIMSWLTTGELSNHRLNGLPFTVKRDSFDGSFLRFWPNRTLPQLPQMPDYPAEECDQHYTTFYIPKKTGGLRQIDAPDEQLKNYLSQMKYYFEHQLHIIPADNAHAYIKGRCCRTAIERHQKADHKWFLKIDMHDFFGSHTLDYVMSMLKMVYPISEVTDETYLEDLRNHLKYAFLNGKLPQGTPLSPTLTNICMVPIDYELQHELFNGGMVYTRYADDLLISSKIKWNYHLTEEKINNILKTFNAPFTFNAKKTHFGSRSGRNWNLGIMLNKDNEITIGHKQKQRFRAMLFNFLKDNAGGWMWSGEDRMRLKGLISYYHSIDPEDTKDIIERYEQKFGVSLKVLL